MNPGRRAALRRLVFVLRRDGRPIAAERLAGEPRDPLRSVFGFAADARWPSKLDGGELVRHPVRQTILVEVFFRIVDRTSSASRFAHGV